MKKLIAAVVTLLGLLGSTLVGVVATAPAAQAVEGCSSDVILKADTWGEDFKYQSVYGRPQGWIHTIRLSGTTAYWYCPNGTNPDKIKIRYAEWCWTDVDSNGQTTTFEGVNFDGLWGTDYSRTNAPRFFVYGNSSRFEGCGKQDIALDQQKWFTLSNGPKWSVSAQIMLMNEHYNHTKEFRWPYNTSTTVKPIRPGDDFNLSGWFR